MKFVAFAHYNNNGDILGEFSSPTGEPYFNEDPVQVTSEGLTLFHLPENFSVEKKLYLLEKLDDALQARFDCGIDVVASGFSDCYLDFEIEPLLSGAKDYDEGIKTLFVGHPSSRNSSQDSIFGADYSFYDGINNQGEKIISHVSGVTDRDFEAPVEGWDAFSEEMQHIYRQSLKDVQMHANVVYGSPDAG